MDALVVPKIDTEAEDDYVTEADWIPAFWNFLSGLDRDDLIAELIQNDLDQDATRTVISFEQDRLVCEGNGRPVDAEGWQRLRKIQGAGHTVPAKRAKIGIKNHGLKTAFKIGDEIRLLSAGQAITQTLYRHGRRKPPFPGASPSPKPDPQAPLAGCRIIVKYRNAAIEPREGEAIVLGAVGEQEIEALFRSACANVPEQFAGIVSPEVAPRYEIILRHWRLGEAHFVFSCTKPRKAAKGIELFRRRCDVSGSAPSLTSGVQEQAARRLLPLRGRLKERVPDFFRRENCFVIEVSWAVDGRGRPMTGAGRFRYPIGYPASSQQARTGHGIFFNAPIVSDTERHGPARNDATNDEVRKACEKLAVDALARCAVPRWGADGLNPLVPNGNVQEADKAVRPLLAALARLDAIPALGWDKAVPLLIKGGKRSDLPAALHLHRRERPAAPREYGFAIPVPRWKKNVIHAPLAVMCPRSEKQLDPRVHPEIIQLLADGDTEGFCERFITFDEHDALTRIVDACDHPERDFANLLFARSCLDVINEAIKHGKCEAQIAALQAGLLLPDSKGEAAALRTLYTSAPLPSDIPGLRLPPILHKDLASHPLFRRKKWRRPAYTMARFLGCDALRGADRQTRTLFWNWLCRNERHIARRDHAALTALPIWPDSSDDPCRLAELCEPKSRRVAAILGHWLRRPHESVLKSRLAASEKTGRTRVRSVPSQSEITSWLEYRTAPFAPNATPEVAVAAALGRFEAEIAVLLKDATIARVLKGAHADLPALAQDGSLARRRCLVMPDADTNRLALPKRFLLSSRAHAAALDRLSPSLPKPNPPMLMEAFREDGGNFAALQARLSALLAQTERGDSYRSTLAGLPIFPAHGTAHAPRSLAFTGPQGDYWGAWKTRISAKGLSQDDQRRYLAAGVTSATPTPETSRAFFEWLAGQDTTVIERHVSCALRHILHRNGPESWAEKFPDTPFIPARGCEGVQFVSLRTVRRRPIYLPDVRDIAEAILEKDSEVLLVIDRLREVSEPVSAPLRALGVRSLREAIGEPEHVAGSGAITEAPAAFRGRFEALRSQQFRKTFFKRLDELGVDAALVWRDWQDRLAKVASVRCADQVTVCYRLDGRTYALPAQAGFDRGSGTFWIKQEEDRGISSIYEAIAAQLVFKPAAPPVYFLALERALSIEIHDPSFGRPGAGGAAAPDEKAMDSEAEQAEAEQAAENGPEPGEAIFGHSPFEPDPARNIPNPRPIPPSPAAAPPSRRAARGDSSSDSNCDPKPTPELEREHVEALKKEHYASHCQMCLCKRSPQELAPAGSYVEWEEVRRRIVEAHHPDMKSGGGARHAGNLVLLCKLHHDNYGRRLTRAAVSAALSAKATQTMVRFTNGGGNGLSEVQGRTIEIVIPDSGEVVSLFFTEQHAAYWLSQT